jgi:hypothetical protein
MGYSILRIAAWLTGLFSFTIVIARFIPYDEGQIHAFISAPENCGGECLFGIRPGTTTLGETLDFLYAHPWVESVQLTAPGNGYGQIRWEWNGKQPTAIDGNRAGRITFYWDREEQNAPEMNDTLIQTIAIHTRLRMFSLQQWFGKPSTGTASIRLDGSLGYSAAYQVQGRTIVLTTILPCPISLMNFWNAQTQISMSIGRGTSTFVPPVEMVKLC